MRGGVDVEPHVARAAHLVRALVERAEHGHAARVATDAGEVPVHRELHDVADGVLRLVGPRPPEEEAVLRVVDDDVHRVAALGRLRLREDEEAFFADHGVAALSKVEEALWRTIPEIEQKVGVGG